MYDDIRTTNTNNSDIINFGNIFNNSKKMDSQSTKRNHAYNKLYNSDYDMVSYNYFESFNNLDIKSDYKGSNYVEIDLDLKGDILTEFKVINENGTEIKCVLEVEIYNTTKSIDKNDVILTCCGYHVSKKTLRVYLPYEKESNLMFSCKAYVCNMNFLKKYQKLSLIMSDILYKNGCIKLK